jgi:riboflavin synthase
MFTGIIEGLGRVVELRPTSGGARLTVSTTLDYSDVALGDSIAVNGCCLTAVDIGKHQFAAELSHETLARTTSGELRPGAAVNLERALRVGDRLGGHMVQGHVDGVGHVQGIVPQGNAVDWHFDYPVELHPFFVAKGSVAIDGISLTVNAVSPGRLSVTIIPHTASVTALQHRRVGDRVNLETDIVGKYIVAQLERTIASTSGPSRDARLLSLLEQSGFRT